MFLATVEIAAENDKRWDGTFGCTITHASPWIAQHVSKSMDQFRALRNELRNELLKLDGNAAELVELPAPLRLFTKAEQSHNQAQRDACFKLLTMVGQSEFLASSVPVRRFLFAPPKPPKPELTLRLTTPTASSSVTKTIPTTVERPRP